MNEPAVSGGTGDPRTGEPHREQRTDTTRTRPVESHPEGAARGGKTREVVDEFRSVVLGQGRLLDAVLPSLVFLVVRALADDRAAMLAALLAGASVVLFRVLRRQPPLTAVFGLLGSVLAFLVALGYQRAELFFLPDVITNLVVAAACLVSAALRRPLVAWTSHLVRRWPREWYWHPRVLPAYRETTLAWAVFFLLQAGIQGALVVRQEVGLTAISNILNAWPATAVLLVLTYLYGTWRLPRLAGPSVEEYRKGSPPPWSGQSRGF
jgi:Protein of unknown function (DUF3159)